MLGIHRYLPFSLSGDIVLSDRHLRTYKNHTLSLGLLILVEFNLSSLFPCLQLRNAFTSDNSNVQSEVDEVQTLRRFEKSSRYRRFEAAL